MVKVTQVDAKKTDKSEPVKEKSQTEKDEDFVDTDSEISDDDDDDIFQESLVDRVAALKDVVPLHYRVKLMSQLSSLSSMCSSSLTWGGKALWVIATSALLLGVPLSLSIVNEEQLSEMEKEMSLTQASNKVIAPGAESGFSKSQS